jgi:hypothetical protein
MDTEKGFKPIEPGVYEVYFPPEGNSGVGLVNMTGHWNFEVEEDMKDMTVWTVWYVTRDDWTRTGKADGDVKDFVLQEISSGNATAITRRY